MTGDIMSGVKNYELEDSGKRKHENIKYWIK